MHNYPFESLQMMSRVGAMASDLCLHDTALKVFSCLMQLRPGSPYPAVSMALALSRSGDSEAALAMLHDIVSAHSENEMAKVLLAVHLHAAKKTGAAALLEGVLKHGTDPEALELAHAVGNDITRPENDAVTTDPPSSGVGATRLRHYTRIQPTKDIL